MTTAAWAAVALAVAGGYAALALLALHRRERPGAGVAAALWATLSATGAVLAAGAVGPIGPATAVDGFVVGWLVAVPLWAAFAAAHTGRGPRPTGRLAAAGAVVVALTAAASLAGGLPGAAGQVLRVAAAFLQTAVIALGLFGVLVVVRAAATHGDLETGAAVALAVAGGAVTMAVFAASAFAAATGATLSAATLVLAVALAGFGADTALYAHFDRAPRAGPLARRAVLAATGDAVLVVDRAGRVVDANPAAADTLGVDPVRDAGRDADAVLGYDLGAVASGTAALPTPRGRRRLDVRRSALTNAAGETVGASYLVRDVTDERTRAERLSVFSRVLRHNLRNDLDAVRGFAEAMADDSAPEPATAATRVRSTARDLADLAATVERADRVVTREALAVAPVDVADLASSVADDVGASHGRTVPTSATGDAVVATDREILRVALRELVENALEHGATGADGAAAVEVTTTATDDGARVTVRDDGPGIPEAERAVLLEGEETPLRHGTGVGLWVVSWAVARLGGDLSFRDRAAGTAVTVAVPDRSPEG